MTDLVGQILSRLGERPATARDILASVPSLGDTTAAVGQLKRLTLNGTVETKPGPGGNVLYALAAAPEKKTTTPKTQTAARSSATVETARSSSSETAALIIGILGREGSVRAGDLWLACAAGGVERSSAKYSMSKLIASGAATVSGRTVAAVYTLGPAAPQGREVSAMLAGSKSVERAIGDLLIDMVQLERRATSALLKAALQSSDSEVRRIAIALHGVQTGVNGAAGR